MSLKPKHFAPLIAAVAVAVAPVAVADPVSYGSASSVIVDLKSQGYLIQMNWVSGYNTEPLDVCHVTGVNIPGDTPASRTTAYVDVSCPNHPDDGGFGFGAGIGRTDAEYEAAHGCPHRISHVTAPGALLRTVSCVDL